MMFLHVAQMRKKDIFSPIDNLKGLKLMEGMQYNLEFEPHV